MKNKKGLRIFLTLVLAVLMIGTAAIYLYEVLVQEKAPSENLLKFVILEASLLIGIVKLYTGTQRRRSLDFYDSQYPSELKNAFVNDPKNKKALLLAIRKYNENQFDSAIVLLKKLVDKCTTHADLYSVKLFLALALTDRGSHKAAVSVYENMMSEGLVSATVYGNVGSLYTSLGMMDKAFDVYKLAITAYPDAHIAYNNLAQLEFKLGDFDSAKEHAHKAVEISFKNYQAASLLAMIYDLEENVAEATKYTQMAISAGQNAIKLQQAKAYYKNAFSNKEDVDFDGNEEEDQN